MPRQMRCAKENTVYHVLNRANGRLNIFKTAQDVAAIEAMPAVEFERRAGTGSVLKTGKNRGGVC